MCSHSTGIRWPKGEPYRFITTLAMLFLPILVQDHLNQIYVDSLVNSLDIKNFVDDFSAQITAQITLVSDIILLGWGIRTHLPVTGRGYHGNQRQFPCCPRFRYRNDSRVHFEGIHYILCQLHVFRDVCATLQREIENAKICSLSDFFVCSYKSDIIT